MSSNRKRKLAVVSAPTEDLLNANIKRQSDIGSNNNDITGDLPNEENSAAKLVDECKVFNDPVHGHFELPKLLFKFIDTPQFQRLRHIKQLGATELVFPGATHNRFEHCLGVAYLAGRMCKSLLKRQPELGITKVDVLCVQIAGLCHDLGHGPFSHFFDGLFLPKARPNFHWEHEKGSVDMLDHLIEENGLMPILQSCGFTAEDICFIKELVLGPLKNKYNETEWPYEGRAKDKSYLYEIVANKRTGIDVDKWDYFARDCYHLGISNNFDYRRFMKFARVVSVDGKLQVCTRDKEVSTLYDMFHTRNSLHRRAYQHKTVKIIDIMLCDMLLKANDHLLIPGQNGKGLKMSECIEDMVAYTKLNDNIITMIDNSVNPKLTESKALLRRIQKRDLYHLAGQTILSEIIKMNEHGTLCESIVNLIESDFIKEDFEVHIIEFNYGMQDKDPIKEVRFYNKEKPNMARKVKKDQVSQMLPERFAEQHLRFYYKGYNENLLEEAKRAFKTWCKSKTCATVDVDNPELTTSVEEK